MKKLLFKLLALVVVLCSVACQKDLLTYAGKEGVYFGVQWGPAHGDSTVWAYQHYTAIEFVKMPDVNAKTITLRVMVTGEAKDYDRGFGVRVNVDSSDVVEGVDFEKLQDSYIVPAGKLYVDVPLTLKRTVALQTTTKVLGINLVPSEDLALSIPTWYPIKPHWSTSGDPIFDATYHRVELSDFPIRPDTWMGLANNGVEAGYLGLFTTKKFNLICELMDLSYEDFESTETMPSIRVGVINQA
ncbi:MAG: DUF4843 domain-containing protein, partial [Sphingobacterium sp.]|nr:DUF4843 domain-containing protein [Sphingobacterium sp.]